MLADIEIDALSVAVRGGLADLAEEARHYSPTGWASRLKCWQDDGIHAVEQGFVPAEARTMAFSFNTRAGIAALAMRPGGVRVCGIVFCATHYPAGTLARFRLSCPQCSPDDTMHSWPRIDPRDVVSIEGTI